MQKISFNRDWHFSLGDPLAFRWWPIDVASLRKVDLPHDWSIELERNPENPSSNLGGYFQMGFGWYIKNFEALPEWQGKRVFIEFEGVFMNAEVWINEHSFGIHPYGYTSFIYDLTPFLKYGSENVLKVAVDNSHPLNARWYTGSGIYRPVWLRVADPVHVANWGVYITTPEISSESAVVRAQTTIENQASEQKQVVLRTSVISPDHVVVGTSETEIVLPFGEQQTITQEILVLDPLLWSPDSPHLYHLESEILDKAGQLLDKNLTTFGIRELHFSAEGGFLLNQQPLKLKGGCVHHDNGILGAASYPRSEERKVKLLKESGFNAIRCAHNPPAPAFLDACDRLGMLVMDEAFDIWREGKNPGDYHLAFDDWWQRDLDSMLYRDRNHPSIILWSIGNEVIERGKPEGVEIARQMAKRIHAIDPTRPVTSAVNDGGDQWPWEQADAFFSELDVCGYNYKWGQYLPDHERFPKRMIIGTESTPGEAFDHWMLVMENNHVLGDFVWTSLDYLGESGIGRTYFEGEQAAFLPGYPWHQANCGDLDLCGFKRPQSFYRDMLWGSGERLYIAVHPPLPQDKKVLLSYWGWHDVWHNWNWQGLEGHTFQLDVYSACEKVELFLNDQSMGIKPTTREERFIASFEVPYAPGVLKAVGYLNGRPVTAYELKTADKACCIRMVPELEMVKAGESDLVFVTIEVVDDQGQTHINAQHTIFFTCQGVGSIAAVGSSDPKSVESYVGNQRKVFRGRCLVAVKTTGEAGEIRLQANADGLQGSEIVIVVN